MTGRATAPCSAASPRHRAALGITLIESLVTITVCGLMIMLGAPQLAIAVRDNRVRAIAEEYASGITLARQEAVARNTRVQFQPSGTGWRVALLASDNSTASVLVSRTGLNSEATYNVSPSATGFTFNGAGRATTPGPTSYSIDFGLVGGTCKSAGGDVRCLRVTVTSGGAVKACDPAAGSTDPRGCT